MEYLILFAALLAVGALAFAMGLWNQRSARLWQKKMLKESFGEPGRREYADGELGSIPRYFEKHQEGFFIDDITWSDLDFDRIFLQMNITCSSAGQEYLYYLLRTPCFDPEELARREELMRFLEKDGQTRMELQEILAGLGRTGKYSLYDYLDFLEDLGERSSRRQILMDLLFLPAIGLIQFSAPMGVACLVTLLCLNISTYLKQKQTIEPYLVSFKYVFRSLEAARRVAGLKSPALAREGETLRELLPRFGRLKKSAALGMRMSQSGNPLDVLFDYVNMCLHLDIISFNVMLHSVRRRGRDIDALLTILGRLDALTAAAGFRRQLPDWCVPELREEGGLEITRLYHPLLTDPVKNDIRAERGVLLTGSNASGKSTFLKAVAVNAILAQTVHTCCADRYRAPFSRVLTSMALRDDLGNGESYFIVEIKALKRILDESLKKDQPGRVLCFVDEVLRGTNTVERIAASAQILRSLERPGVLCFAATHDIELTGLLADSFDNYHFEEVIADGDIRFPYLLMPGKATSRNAIRLLEIMGYNEDIIRRAENMAARFLESGRWE
ncbi:MAG: hypothetical protein Q4C65_14530 [Eubacteriales bacterium]|nr:hypothetical protein [Eubacteriales bacterium]